MQYTVNITSRMLAIAGLCVFLLCVLLFLLGIELGKRFGEPPATPQTAAAPTMPATPAMPGAPAMSAAPAEAPAAAAAVAKP